MRKLKVLHLLSGEGKAGSHTFALNLIKGLAKYGHYVDLVCSPHSFTEKLALKIELNKIYILPTHRVLTIQNLLYIKWLLDKGKYKILHCHVYKDRLLGMFLKTISNFVLICHRQNPPGRKNLFYYVYNKYVDKFIAVSLGVKKKLIDYGIKEEKIKVIYNGINLDYWGVESIDKEKIRLTLNLPRNKIIIGFIGRMVKFYDDSTFLKVISELPKEYILLCVGRDDIPGDFKNVLGERLYIEGFKLDPRPYYKACDIIILPTRAEGFSLSILEAMSFGLPVISNNCCGVNEIIIDGYNGFLIEHGNGLRLKEIILKLNPYSDIYKTISKNCLETVKKFSLENSIKLTEELYFETIDTKNAE